MRLLLVGEINSYVTEASIIVRKNGAAVSHCGDVLSAIEHIASGKGAELVFIDAALDVKSLVIGLTKERISIPVIAYGIEHDTKLAVASIKAGAQEFIPLPPDTELIIAILESIANENNSMICDSVAMQKVIKVADKVAKSSANIFITGESGTGKEVISRYLHGKSKRSGENFVSVNCASIPDNLLESELFGHEKGAFTGAAHRRIGKFEEASGGTLLLDEISEMDIRLQAKLLRAIQENEIDRVGGTKPVKVDLRILATSNRDIRQSINDGQFREDLFFRLNVIELQLPPLRERKSDIEKFATHFIEKYAEINSVAMLPLSKKALEVMVLYDWPGNVRELENSIHRAVLLAGGDEITADDLMLDVTDNGGNSSNGNEANVSDNDSGNDNDKKGDAVTNAKEIMVNDGASNNVGQTIESVEKTLIYNTLNHCTGNKTHAAKILGISIRTLRNKLNSYVDKK